MAIISLTRLDADMTSCIHTYVCICFFMGSGQLGVPGQPGFWAKGIFCLQAVLSSVRVEGRQEYYGFTYSLLATSRGSLAIA